MAITERKKAILRQVISSFISKAEPVSSGRIAAGPELSLSPATIRKEMAELEEMGYLTHPHTSAGKIPTDRGYRFFVDNLLSNNKHGSISRKNDMPDISLHFNREMEIEAILQKSSEMLSRFTSYLSMIVAPTIYQSRFKHIELLKFEGENFLMVLITDTGRVYKKNFTLEGAYTDLDIQAVVNTLNSQFRDKNIVDIDIDQIKIPEGESSLIFLINRITENIKSCVEDSLLYNRIFVHGTSVILQQPEFIDLKKIQDIISVVENEYQLMKLLLDFSEDKDFIIKIGSELFRDGTNDLSLIASKYKIFGNSTGSIGILGPKRMDYHKVINILNLFRKNLTDIFGSKA